MYPREGRDWAQELRCGCTQTRTKTHAEGKEAKQLHAESSEKDPRNQIWCRQERPLTDWRGVTGSSTVVGAVACDRRTRVPVVAACSGFGTQYVFIHLLIHTLYLVLFLVYCFSFFINTHQGTNQGIQADDMYRYNYPAVLQQFLAAAMQSILLILISIS